MTEGGDNGGILWDTIKNEFTMDNYMPHRVRVELDPVKLKTSSGAFSESGVWLHFDTELPPRAEFPTPAWLLCSQMKEWISQLVARGGSRGDTHEHSTLLCDVVHGERSSVWLPLSRSMQPSNS